MSLKNQLNLLVKLLIIIGIPIISCLIGIPVASFLLYIQWKISILIFDLVVPSFAEVIIYLVYLTLPFFLLAYIVAAFLPKKFPAWSMFLTVTLCLPITAWIFAESVMSTGETWFVPWYVPPILPIVIYTTTLILKFRKRKV